MATLIFREKNEIRPSWTNSEYHQNAYQDTWFRQTEGNGKGYGLAIVDFKVTSRKPVQLHSATAYKVRAEYIPWAETEITEIGALWLVLQSNEDLDDVLAYIEANKANWRP